MVHTYCIGRPMTEIALRTYTQEIKDLIEHGHFDEAAAHCQHILESFPRHIETYRLLGKAFLEQGRHGDAADVFQRVLSAIPEDWLSHVAMAIVREDESNLDMAIWHMERAYEVNPSNPTVQQEVRRLRGRRDGVEPPKLRLTRSALARMYIKGGLYGQAIAEIRSALTEDPDRPDLQILLASALYESGSIQEAADICTAILQKLPYCLEANRVLGLAFLASNKPDEAEKLFQRIESLDPYIDLDILKKEKQIVELAGQTVTLSRLEYEGQEKTVRTKQPSWASSLGLKLEEGQKSQSVPDWLNTASPQPSPFPAAPPSAGAAASSAGIPSWLSEAASAVGSPGASGASTASPSIPQAVKEQPIARTSTGELPDWIQAQGVPEEPPPAEKPSAPLPDWLSAAAMPSEAVKPEPSTDSGSLPDWIKTSSLASEQPKEKIEDIPDWLSTPPPPSVEGLPSSSLPEGMRPETKTGPLEVEPGNIPDWLTSSQPTSADTGSEPDWLKETPASAPESQAVPEWMTEVKPVETPSSAPQPDESIPEWLRESPAPASKPVELVPEWMRTETASPPKNEPADVVRPSIQPPSAEELPEWMKSDLAETPSPAPASAGPSIGKGTLPAAQETEIPEWMKPLPSETAAVQEPAAEAPSGSSVPTWLKPPAQISQEHAEPETEAVPENRLPDRLNGPVAGKQEPAEPVEPAEKTPQSAPYGNKSSEPELEGTFETGAEPAPDGVSEITLPDWLKAVPSEDTAQTPAAPPPKTESAKPPAEPAAVNELPDWIQGEPAKRESEAANAVPSAPAQVSETAPDAESTISPEPALETGSAQPTSPEPGPAHVTPTANDGIDLPEWLVTQLQGKPKEAASVSTATQAGSPLPDWLKPAADTTPPPVVDWDKAASQPIPPAPVDATTPATGLSAASPNKPPAGPRTSSDTVARWLDRRLKTSTLSSLDESALKAGIKSSSPPSTGQIAKGTKQLPTWLDSQKPGGSDTVVRWMDKRETGSLRKVQTATFSSVPKSPPSPSAEKPTTPSVSAPLKSVSAAPEPAGGSEGTVASKRAAEETVAERRRFEPPVPTAAAPPPKPAVPSSEQVPPVAGPQAKPPVPSEEEEEEGGFVPPPEWLQKALGSAVAEVPPIPKKQTGGLKPGTAAPIKIPSQSVRKASAAPAASKAPPPSEPVEVSVPAGVKKNTPVIEEPPPASEARTGSWVPLAQTPAPKPEKPVKKSSRKKSRKLSDVEVQAIIREARAYLETDLKKASEAYQQVLDDPAGAETVASDLTTYLEQDPASPQLWNLLGDACSRAGRLQDAYRAYAEALNRM
jgi:tetratricopeptide (TPR) repeat protein